MLAFNSSRIRGQSITSQTGMFVTMALGAEEAQRTLQSPEQFSGFGSGMCGGSGGNKRGKRTELLRGRRLSREAPMQWECRFLTHDRTLKVFEEHNSEGQMREYLKCHYFCFQSRLDRSHWDTRQVCATGVSVLLPSLCHHVPALWLSNTIEWPQNEGLDFQFELYATVILYLPGHLLLL